MDVRQTDPRPFPFAEPEPSLVVFVTGIGQSFSYHFDASFLHPDAFEEGTLQDHANYAPLIAHGKHKKSWNLFAENIGEQFRDRAGKLLLLRAGAGVAASLVTRRCMVSQKTADKLARRAFRANLTDEENRGGDPQVVTPRYTCPLSEYPGYTDENGVFHSHAKDRFYRCVPCKNIAHRYLGDAFEDYLYCFNFPPCSFTSRNVSDLHKYIETVLKTNRVGAKQVVLIPMSMGASVVSAYLARYPAPAQNHVRRVVSVVGCWRGSKVMGDLLLKRFAADPVEAVLRALSENEKARRLRQILGLFSKRSLHGLFDTALNAFAGEIICGAPSLLALVPDEDYPAVRPLLRYPAVLREADAYYEVQRTLFRRLQALAADGVTFGFIAGYGLPLGNIDPAYDISPLLENAENANSDEIIQIESTAPGAASVSYGAQFPDDEGRRLSPEKSVDLAQAVFPDACWLFYRQKHELEYNNTALRLAILLALGWIRTVSDRYAEAGETVSFPQFNAMRDTQRLIQKSAPQLYAFLAQGGKLNEKQQAIYEETLAMLERTVNDPDTDNDVMARFDDMIKEIASD
ncbi:MAG: alpha/beta hydrolase [Clostridia bacterium]|nr:alpha/beta hydrolase [Clostridia bacterium]